MNNKISQLLSIATSLAICMLLAAGCSEPSQQDAEITKKLQELAEYTNKKNEQSSKKDDLNLDIRIKDGISREFVETDTNGDSIYKFTHYDSNGKILEEGLTKKGKYSGEVKWYYRSGPIKIKGYYNDTIPYGNWTEYYESGGIMSEYSYINGNMDGRYKYYYEDGKLWTERVYSRGKLINITGNYDSQGNSKDPGTLKDGNGTVIQYDIKGKEVAVHNYKDGRLVKK
ncbi:MAG: hypothetical protein KJ607_14450 [Bacteroidetes bacterium]|nr:hypothetical protein [Bacteroidota bacterium]